jgi:WD40 repeat protein
MSLWLVQDQKKAHSDSIWTAKFSPCGKLLATGGKDATLKIWQVTPDDDANESFNLLKS